MAFTLPELAPCASFLMPTGGKGSGGLRWVGIACKPLLLKIPPLAS